MRETIIPATLIDQLITSVSTMIQETVHQLQEFLKQGDFLAINDSLTAMTRSLTDRLWTTTLELILNDRVFLKRLRSWGSTQGWQFVSYQPLTIILPTGTRLSVTSPFFVKMNPRRGRKKTRPSEPWKPPGVDAPWVCGQGGAGVGLSGGTVDGARAII